MKRNTLPILIALAIVVGATGLWLSQSRQGQTEVMASNRPLVDQLENQINDITGLRITGAENKLVVELKRGEKGWVAANKSDYPADFAKVREYLLKLAESRLREEKTANPERHARLGVEDLAGKDAKGVGVALEGLKKPVSLIVGTFNANSGQGYFVRNSDQPQTYLASGNIRPDTSLALWLAADIANVGSPRIRSVEITPPTGGKIRIEKTDSAAPDYTVLDLPKGRELSSPSIGNGISTLFDSLKLEDVLSAAEAQPVPESLYKAQFLTQEGMQLTVDGWEVADKAHVRIVAALDPARSEAWLIEEQAKAQAAHDASQAAVAASPAAPAVPAETEGTAEGKIETAAASETPAAKPFDADAFRAEKLTGLQKEVDEINARTAGWTYIVPTWKFANIKKSMDDLLKSKDAK